MPIAMRITNQTSTAVRSSTYSPNHHLRTASSRIILSPDSAPTQFRWRHQRESQPLARFSKARVPKQMKLADPPLQPTVASRAITPDQRRVPMARMTGQLDDFSRNSRQPTDEELR